MNLRNEWYIDGISYQNTFYSKEETVNSVKSNFDIRRYYSAEGVAVIIDGTTEQVIVQDHHNPINESDIDKKLLLPMDTVAKTGSLVLYENENWLINSHINNVDNAYKSCQIQYCNYTLTFQHPTTGAILSYPSITSSTRLGQEEGKVMTLGNNQKSVTIPANETTILLANSEDKTWRFFLDKHPTKPRPYKLVGVDNTSHEGLIELIVEEDQLQTDDRIDLGVCDYFMPQSNPSIGTTYSTITSSTANKELTIGSSGYITLTPTFYNSNNTVNTSIIPVWSFIYPTGYNSLFTVVYEGKLAKIKVASNYYLLGKTVTVNVSNGSGGYNGSLLLTIAM